MRRPRVFKKVVETPHGPCGWASQSPGRWRRRAKQGNFGLGAERPAFWLQPCSQRFLFNRPTLRFHSDKLGVQVDPRRPNHGLRVSRQSVGGPVP